MPDPVTEFYDSLSPHYHLIFAHWQDAVIHHGEILDKLIRTHINVSSTTSLLDCSCGIGTQAIGLALRRYRVHVSDISAKAVERAKKEAQALNALVTFSVADFRYLDKQIAGTYLGLGMGDGDMLAGVALLLARIVLFLLPLLFGTADGPLRSIGQHSQFLEFGKLLNDLFQRAAFR